jgi:hypothetical protein
VDELAYAEVRVTEAATRAAAKIATPLRDNFQAPLRFISL